MFDTEKTIFMDDIFLLRIKIAGYSAMAGVMLVVASKNSQAEVETFKFLRQ
ncbi:MAG: hypothetical protein ABIQ74_09390 [Chitinophagales bacterium]